MGKSASSAKKLHKEPRGPWSSGSTTSCGSCTGTGQRATDAIKGRHDLSEEEPT